MRAPEYQKDTGDVVYESSFTDTVEKFLKARYKSLVADLRIVTDAAAHREPRFFGGVTYACEAHIYLVKITGIKDTLKGLHGVMTDPEASRKVVARTCRYHSEHHTCTGRDPADHFVKCAVSAGHHDPLHLGVTRTDRSRRLAGVVLSARHNDFILFAGPVDTLLHQIPEFLTFSGSRAGVNDKVIFHAVSLSLSVKLPLCPLIIISFRRRCVKDFCAMPRLFVAPENPEVQESSGDRIGCCFSGASCI